MSVPASNLPAVYLRPGEMHFGADPMMVSTVLGSCISVTMFSPRFNVGAICHALLPACKTRVVCRPMCEDRFKYVDCSVRSLVRLFETKGVPRQGITVKVFGGSDMMTADERRACLSVGKQNIAAARDALSEERLSVAVSDTGGTSGRKVFFFTGTGEVLLKRIHKAQTL